MAPRWEPSSEKHGVVYIGPEHAQTDRELEILIPEFPDGREALIFPAMPLGPKFSRYREEHPDGWK